MLWRMKQLEQEKLLAFLNVPCMQVLQKNVHRQHQLVSQQQQQQQQQQQLLPQLQPQLVGDFVFAIALRFIPSFKTKRHASKTGRVACGMNRKMFARTLVTCSLTKRSVKISTRIINNAFGSKEVAFSHVNQNTDFIIATNLKQIHQKFHHFAQI